MSKKFFTMSQEPTVVPNDEDTVERRDFDVVMGTGGPEDPVVAFCDKELLISSEQFSYHGRWRGWMHEVLDEKEYFKRRLAGK